MFNGIFPDAHEFINSPKGGTARLESSEISEMKDAIHW
jgi:hypothetical protein